MRDFVIGIHAVDGRGQPFKGGGRVVKNVAGYDFPKPPSLSFDASVVTRFLDLVRKIYKGPMVCEPRHATWFSPAVASLLDRCGVSRVAADPSPVPDATVPAGSPRVAYFRLHGSPRTYWSRYGENDIATLAAAVRNVPNAEEVWCVFDNTASGAAIENAWELRERLIVDPPLV